MRLDPVLVLLLLSHIISDFYLQTNRIAEQKETSIKALLRHGGLYALGVGAALLVGMPVTRHVWQMIVYLSAFHLLIDYMKYVLVNQTRSDAFTWMKKRAFILDQCLHLLIIIVAWRSFGADLSVSEFIGEEMPPLPAPPVTVLLGLLCALRPVGILIGTGEIWEGFRKQKDDPKDASLKNAGRIIGYLERLIILFCLMYQQFAAIAFVLTAKSLARFKEIEENQMKAEYYLIGTLLSASSVFLIAFLLGFLGK